MAIGLQRVFFAGIITKGTQPSHEGGVIRQVSPPQSPTPLTPLARNAGIQLMGFDGADDSGRVAGTATFVAAGSPTPAEEELPAVVAAGGAD